MSGVGVDSERWAGFAEQVQLAFVAGAGVRFGRSAGPVIAVGYGPNAEPVTRRRSGAGIRTRWRGFRRWAAPARGEGRSWLQVLQRVVDVLGADGSGVVQRRGQEGVVGDALDEPWQAAGALEQRFDGGRFEQGHFAAG